MRRARCSPSRRRRPETRPRLQVRAEPGRAPLSTAMPASRSLQVHDEARTRRGGGMARVFIGVDSHQLSVTIEVVDDHESVLATGRFSTDQAGYAAMRKQVRAWPERVWAVEGSNGAGRPLAQRLLADGEHVVDVPAKLSARARLLDTGHGRKTDAHDAHAVAVVAVRTEGLRVLSYDERARGAADAGRPPRGAVPAAGPDRQPVAAAAVRADPREGEEGPDRLAGQGNSRFGAAAGPGRQDPATARGRAADRAGRGRQEDQGPHAKS